MVVRQFTIYTDAGSPVSWEHTTVGMVGAYPSPALQSTTAGNGWMKADSDAFGSQGGAQEYTETNFSNYRLFNVSKCCIAI